MSFFKAKGGSGFQLIPEGKDVLLRVDKVEYDETFFTDQVANVEVDFVSVNGASTKQRYNLAHEIGGKIFTLMIKFAFNDFTIQEGDDIKGYVDNLVGKFLLADITHEESGMNETTGKPYINVRLNNMRVTEETFGELPKKEAVDTETGEVIDDGSTEEFVF